MRIDRLTTLLEFVKALPPERLELGLWAEKNFDQHDCRTTACLGGWCCVIWPKALWFRTTILEKVITDRSNRDSIRSLIDFFELDWVAATNIFLDTERTVREAIEYLERFINENRPVDHSARVREEVTARTD